MIARGSIAAVDDEWIIARMPRLRAGTSVRIAATCGWIRAIVSSVTEDGVRLTRPVTPVVVGAVVEEDERAGIVCGTAALGRAIDAYGAPLDGGLPLVGLRSQTTADVPSPAERAPIVDRFWTGVRSIDTLLTMGRGARVGIFGPPGAGKSTLLESIVRGARADAVVLALVGERGREAQEWIERLTDRISIVCATSDRAAQERVAAAFTAFAHARALARRGLHVLLVLDSLARVAYALREVASAGNEPLGRGGYPVSVFAALARLVECAGLFTFGSITLIATVLSDGDERDPVSESARSLLDGHIMLAADLAAAGRYPAIDVLASSSRTMAAVTPPGDRDDAARVRAALARLASIDDLRSLGIEPSDPAGRRAVGAEDAIERLLRQGRSASTPSESLAMLAQTADILK